jgi:hypothetical protein
LQRLFIKNHCFILKSFKIMYYQLNRQWRRFTDVIFGLKSLAFIYLLLLSFSLAAQPLCFPFVTAGPTTDLPATPVRPFCPTSGFNVMTTIANNDCDGATQIDFFVFLSMNDKTSPIKSVFDPGNPDVTAAKYFSNIVYAGTSGVTLEEVYYPDGFSFLKGFRFRYAVDGNATTTLNLPFIFEANWFFGDFPWDIYVMPIGNDGVSPVTYPSKDELSTMIGTQTAPLFGGVLLNAITFENPYYPIVGSQNASTHYHEMTQLFTEPFRGLSLGFMLIPTLTDPYPVFTIDLQAGMNVALATGVTGTTMANILMAPGSQIVVQEGSFFQMSQTQMLTGCADQVHKGLVLESGASGYIIEGSVIRDAEIGIHMKKGSFLTLVDVNFENNYQAVFLDNASNPYPWDASMYAGNTLFQSSGNLKAPYPGMTAPTCTKGYGLRVKDLPLLNFFGGNNRFSRLNNGIYLERSSAVFEHIRINNIFSDEEATPIHGHAIYGLGTGKESLTINGHNEPTIFPREISNSEVGVFVYHMDLDIHNAGIQAEQDIAFSKCHHKKVVIRDNYLLQAETNAIKGMASLPTNSASKIEGNTIYAGSEASTIQDHSAILLIDQPFVPEDRAYGWNVKSNVIDLDKVSRGITGLNGNKYRLVRNQVRPPQFSGPSQAYYGYDFTNSDGLEARCNKFIPLSGSGQSERGFTFRNVRNALHSCNESKSATLGTFFANMCDNTVYRGNIFDANTVGLQLSYDVTLGTQGVDDGPFFTEDHGNIWKQFSAPNQAVHGADDEIIVVLSQFGVDPVENPEFKPTNNWGEEFFKTEIVPVASFNCPNCTSIVAEAVPGGEGRELELSIAGGGIHTIGLPGATAQMLENHLYTRLQRDTALRNERTLFQQFLQNEQNTSTGQFYAFRDGIERLHLLSATEQAQVAEQAAEISSISATLYTLDSLYYADSSLNQPLYRQQMGQLAAAQAQLKNILEAQRTQKLGVANALLGQNAALPATELWEQVEKAVNHLDIQYFIHEGFSAAQKAELDALASLCEVTHGEAVLRAQGLYNLLVEKHYVSPCVDAGRPSERQQQTPATTESLYPNPSSGAVMLPAAALGQWVAVYDLSGRQVFGANASERALDLSQLANGLYLLRVGTKTYKVVIQH